MGTLDSDANTMGLLNTLFKEVAAVFNESEIIHFGADEACKSNVCPGNCTFDGVHAVEEHVQKFIKSIGKTPMGWNDVYSDPPTTVPNAAVSGTVIQNWGKTALDKFATAGFHVLDSSYQQMYLGEQCCRTTPPTGAHDKFSLCYWKDTAKGVMQSHMSMIDGGEVAMWSDMYCASPGCAINGTFSWMYP